MPPLAAVHLAVLLFGAAGLFGKLIALPATLIVLGRVVFASLTLGLLLRWRADRGGAAAEGVPARTRSLRDRAGLAGLGLLLAVHWVTFFHAIQVSSVAVGLLTFATFPVFTAILEPLLPGERFDGRALVAAVATVVGVSLVVPAPDPSNPVTRGALWGVISGLTFAVLALANRGWVRRESALRLAFHQDVWAMVFLLPLAGAAGRWPTPEEWGLLLVLGVVFTAGAHGLFIHGLKEITAGRAAVITSLEPVYGVALAVVLLGERPTPRTLVGGAVVLVAATWVSRSESP